MKNIKSPIGTKLHCKGWHQEAAYRMSYINKAQLLDIAEPLLKSGYGEYLIKLANS